jgi:hypothetical protein
VVRLVQRATLEEQRKQDILVSCVKVMLKEEIEAWQLDGMVRKWLW